MHRLASCPGVDPPEDVVLVEQPAADVLFLSSAATDLSTLAAHLASAGGETWRNQIRGLSLDCLSHPAQLDHYLATTADHATLVLVRLLGGRGHWSYGLEQLQRWKEEKPERQLLILAGTDDQNNELHGLGSIHAALADRLAELLREGGVDNLGEVLRAIELLLQKQQPNPIELRLQPMPDPAPWDWQEDAGPRIGVVLYRAQLQAGDVALAEALCLTCRDVGLCPRLLWVSSLRDPGVQAGVIDLLRSQEVELVVAGTSFASVKTAEAGLGSPLWEQLNVPVLQLLSSSRSRESWRNSTRGLDPLDLSLQVVMPELDGRLTTRPCAFREHQMSVPDLGAAVPSQVPDLEGIQWLIEHSQRWITLRKTDNSDRRIAMVLANYPVRDGRIANGVGLDTPASCAAMLQWLKHSSHNLGPATLPSSGDSLMQTLMQGRTNSPEGLHRPALDYLPLDVYEQWWGNVPPEARAKIAKRWGQPRDACDLDPKRGFAIHGLRYGHVVVLIQPDRGYDPDQIADLHSPDLPPPHRYLAQYLWLNKVHQTQVMVHVGKHGSAEWLPGKGVGLSSSCGPHLALGPLPHLYPFIVNDPGEGSQAKRRGHAVVLDHLTPPLGRAGLHGPLQRLEGQLDELVEARQLGAERSELLERAVLVTLQELNWPGVPSKDDLKCDPSLINECLDSAETYLCELKEAQIRTGLHRFGQRPSKKAELELLLALARPPAHGRPGLTQAMARQVGLAFDPWGQEDGEPLDQNDRHLLEQLGCERRQRVGDGVAWLEDQAFGVVSALVSNGDGSDLVKPFRDWIHPQASDDETLAAITQDLWPRLIQCAPSEKKAFCEGISGGRISAGPSGAPSRGRPDVLPTGRNFYSVDLRGLPTEAAWDLGRRSAEQLLELHLQEEGESLKHLALSVWGTATMRNGGEDIAQLLALIGVRPVWDGPTRRLVDLEVIPLSLLGRPRVDVVLRISGLFRDAFPQLVMWIDQAIAMVASLNEPSDQNPLAALTQLEGPQGRIYGSAPGAYGAGLQALMDSGSWDSRSDLGEAFLQWSQWNYGGSSEPSKDRKGLESALQRVQVVLHNQDNREHDLLDSDDYYQFHGGLSAAVETCSGRRPELWFGDHSRRERPRLHRLEHELDKVMRSRLLNPRWIEGMQQHGYKGAFEMGASLDYLFAYDAATDRVPDWCYGALCDQWLNTPEIVEFLERRNPWVLRDMAERLLEASNRGLWEGAEPDQIDLLQSLVSTSEGQIERGGLTTCSDPEPSA
ncbi:Cobaltochelatase, CobN subunit [Synechococcus sp. BL107]|uniref:cobaltochelatase subunit CobN n=1 Tax=Synechococcus sp. BL107 TaxID=313625 RepID=UPI0000E5447E|nr:cobaltochelatase subunit CobN [Synechococcus sp. BL107]EAU71724.1 Cobaltochelatase, CobN subunit [Synechococcus sp. BL107]